MWLSVRPTEDLLPVFVNFSRRARASALFREILSSCSGVSEKAAMWATGGEGTGKEVAGSICDNGVEQYGWLNV